MDNLRRAILLFSICLCLVLAVVGFSMAVNYKDERNSKIVTLTPQKVTENPDDDPTVPGEPVDCGRGIFFLITGEGDTPNLTFLAFLGGTGESRFNLVFIPHDTAFAHKDENGETITGTFADFSDRNIDVALDVVGEMFGMMVSDYIITDFSGIGDLADCFTKINDGIDFRLPCDIPYMKGNTLNKINKNTRYLYGSEVERLFAFSKPADGNYSRELVKYYDGDDICRVRMCAAFAKTFAMTRLVKGQDQHYAEHYATLLKEYCKGVLTNVKPEKIDTIVEKMKLVEKENVYSYIILTEKTELTNGIGKSFMNKLIKVNYTYDNFEFETLDESATKEVFIA